MARLEQSVLGFISGKLGDVVLRRMNGQKFISLGAKKYKISQSEEAKKGRANFAAAVKFAKAVNSIPEIKEAWSAAKTEGTNSYHRIIKYNSKRVNSGRLTVDNRITPEGLPLKLNSLLLNGENKLELNISFAQDKIDFPALICIMFVFNNNVVHKQNMIIESEKVENPLKVHLNDTIILNLRKYPNPMVYAAILGKNNNPEEIFWTSSAAEVL